MYSWSSTIKGYYLAGNPQGVSLSITDGSSNTITVTEADIMEGSFVIDRMSSLGGGIPLGTVYSNQLDFSLRKSSALAAFDWQGAKIDVTLKVWNGSSWSTAGNGGRFYVRKRKIRATTIDIQAIGCMAKMDKMSNKAGVAANNCKLSDIIGWVAADSGVTIQNPDFPTLANFALGAFKFPTGNDMTDRSLLAWVAVLLGCTVIETGNSDTVKLIRKSGSTQNLTPSNLFSVDNDEPVTMTGVDGYDSAGNKLSQGIDGYKMVIQGNAIYETATSVQSTLLSRLWTSLGGFTATPFTAECLAMPWVECADGIKYTDLDGNDHYSVVTHINYKLNGRTTIECGMAEEDDRNNALALAPFIERSSVSTGMLRTDAIKSANYDYTSGNFSNHGTFLNLADGVFTSKNFAIDASGNAYIRGNVQAASGNIGALDIDADGLELSDVDGDDNPYTRTAFKRDYLIIDDPDDDAVFQVERSGSQVRLLWYDSGLMLECTNSKIEMSNGSSAIEVYAATGEILMSGDIYLDDDTTHTIKQRLQSGGSDTWRPIEVGGTRVKGSGTNTGAINFSAGDTNISVWESGGTIYFGLTCLIEGTKILMADGTEKPIEEIRQGDEVASWDINLGKRTTAVVVSAIPTGTDFEYTAHLFDNGAALITYGKHSVYNKTLGHPTDIANFRPGDETYDADGNVIAYCGNMRYAVQSERKRHFDINTSNNLYYANGILNGKKPFAKYRAMKMLGMTLPIAIAAVKEEQEAADALVNGYTTNPAYFTAIAEKLKEQMNAQKTLDNAKKQLADTDYIVAKFTEGLISATEWIKSKAERAGYREAVNTAEAALTAVEKELKAIKKKFRPVDKTLAERFAEYSEKDNAALAEYRAWLGNKQ